MAKKLEKLTDAQLARLPEIRDEWLKIGLSTDPLNFDAAKEAVIDAYKAAGMEPPKLFFRFGSPLTAAYAAAILKNIDFPDQVWDQVGAQVWAQVRDQVGDQVGAQVWAQVRDQVGAQVRAQVWDQVGAQVRDQVGDQVWDQVRDQVWDQVGAQVWAQVRAQVWDQVRDQVWDQVRDQVGDQVWDQVWDQVYGAHDANWLGFYAAFSEFGLDAAEKLKPLMELSKHCGWWTPYAGAVILQDRPSVIRFDDQKRLHCEDGPAICYFDGAIEVYAWHGTRIPKEWILDKGSLTPKIALSESNVERRRAACEIIGWANVLKQLKAKTINKHENEEIGELLEVNIPDSGKEKFLRVRCGTKREFAIPVPPTMKTALEASAWTYAMEDALNDYVVEVRT